METWNGYIFLFRPNRGSRKWKQYFLCPQEAMVEIWVQVKNSPCKVSWIIDKIHNIQFNFQVELMWVCCLGHHIFIRKQFEASLFNCSKLRENLEFFFKNVENLKLLPLPIFNWIISKYFESFNFYVWSKVFSNWLCTTIIKTHTNLENIVNLVGLALIYF